MTLRDMTRERLTGAALELADLMSELSEECYCAGWLHGCEFELWSMVQHGPRSWGLGEITAAHIDRLRVLSIQCGGWVVHWENDAGRKFVPMAKWLGMYARERALWTKGKP